MAHKTHPRLDRAPITEAILDIQVETDAKLELRTRSRRRSLVRTPESFPVFAVEAFFAVTPASPDWREARATPSEKSAGTRRRPAVQARTNGFTVNHVKHYEAWSVLRSEARLLWEEYVALTQPKKVMPHGPLKSKPDARGSQHRGIRQCPTLKGVGQAVGRWGLLLPGLSTG